MSLRSALLSVAALAAVAPPAVAGTGSSCADPVRWELTPEQAVGVTNTRIRELQAHGVRITGIGDLFGYSVTAEARRDGWRVCAMGGAGWWLPGTTGQGGRRSFARRLFEPSKPAHGMYVTFARRSTADGGSCANPFVVYHSYANDGDGDSRAGRIRASDDASAGHELITRTADWQSATGYRTCWAAGIGTRSPGFVDRRRGGSLTHVIDRYRRGPNHPAAFRSLYAAFAKVP